MLSVAGGVAGQRCWPSCGVRLLVRMVRSDPGSLMLDVRPDLRVLLLHHRRLPAHGPGLRPGAGVAIGARERQRHAEGGRPRPDRRAAPKSALGKILVIGQIAISVMLLIGAGWFMRTLRNLENVDLGYARERLVLVDVDFLSARLLGRAAAAGIRRTARPAGAHPRRARRHLFAERAVQRQRIGRPDQRGRLHVAKAARTCQRASTRSGPDYFAIVGIPMLLGRDIGPQDVDGAEPVCVVNETFAKFYFGGANPIGKHVTDEFPDTRKTFAIVGVARDARDHSLRREIFRRFYLAARQPLGGYRAGHELRDPHHGRSGAVIEAVAQSDSGVRSGDPASARRKTLVTLLDDNLRQERIIAQLSAVFGGLALLLAAIGLYGVLSYAVAQRTNEIGIRMALGAGRGTVVRMILRETVVLIAIGLAVGIPASLACARLVQSKLFGLKPADPLTLAVALGVMIAVALVSGYLPARRASKVDPLVALRYE